MAPDFIFLALPRVPGDGTVFWPLSFKLTKKKKGIAFGMRLFRVHNCRLQENHLWCVLIISLSLSIHRFGLLAFYLIFVSLGIAISVSVKQRWWPMVNCSEHFGDI